MLYHVGILQRGDALVIQARRCLDCLSPELLEYQGQRLTTKRQLQDNAKDARKRQDLLDLYNQRFPGRNLRRVKVD